MIFRELEQKVVKDINESGLSIDAIYYIMKNLMNEIENRYLEFCKKEDEEKIKLLKNKEEENEEKE